MKNSNAMYGDPLIERLARLSPEKWDLLNARLNKKRLLSCDETIPRSVNRDSVPLSFAQQRLWFLDQLEPHSSVYNIANALRLKGPLNRTAVQHSLDEIVRRHEALRTTFVTREEQLFQVISAAHSVVLSVLDLSGERENECEAQLRRFFSDAARRPFDLARGPLLRAGLLRLSPEDHVLVLTQHHIVSDGWSMGVFFRELAILYESFCQGKPSPLPELPIQYADYAVWQRRWLAGEVLETQLSYWKKQLDGVSTLKLPTDRPRPPVQSYRGARRYLALSKELTGKLKTLSRREGVTLFMTLLAAFKLLLHRYSGQKDIVVGSPLAGRNRLEIEGLIGLFVNTLILRTDVSGNPSFRELLARVREVALAAYTHQDLPFENLVENLRPERDLSYSPLFQVLFVLHNAPMEPQQLAGLAVSPVTVDSETAKFDLTLSMREQTEGLSAVLEYSTDLFDAPTVERMLRHFRTLLDAVAGNPDQHIWDLPLLSESERHQLVVQWNDTRHDYPKDQTLHELFEQQVARTPDAVALIFEEQKLTYRELNTRANQLAHTLRELGIGPEMLVGICMTRSIEMVVAVLGVLKAGGAFVPLDPAYPRERLACILQEDAQVSVILTESQLIESLPQPSARVLCLDTHWDNVTSAGQENLSVPVHRNNLAYVLYTSGSTGKPKGVAIEHRSAVALLSWAQTVFSAQAMAGVLASTSLCFDLSVFELFAPLTAGGKVILAHSILALPALPSASEVTLVNTVPSAIAELMTHAGIPSSVRVINLAGEPLKSSLVQQIYETTSAKQVYDLYGPSEDTTYSTYALRTVAGPQTIGRPIANTQIYILDPYLNPVPVGICGELHISGDGLARGFLNSPDLTAEKFIPNPFGDTLGARLYKTGDLARYLPDGNIEFLGRLDHQVKIRGFRIELGEIEAVLSQHSAVRETVVMAREDMEDPKSEIQNSKSDDRRLVAYIVSNRQPNATTQKLRSFLKQKLPDYMVPSAFVFLESLPLTSNGKVDRKALPFPDRTRPDLEQSFAAARTPIEELLASIWARVLKLDRVGIHDNFFDIGGHSLLATQLASRIQQTFKVDLPLRSLFEKPSIAELAPLISRIQAEKEGNVYADMLADIESLSDEEAQILTATNMRQSRTNHNPQKSFLAESKRAELMVPNEGKEKDREGDHSNLVTAPPTSAADLPPDQRAIRARCFHPSQAFVKFEKKDIEQSIPARFESIVTKYPNHLAVKTLRREITYDELNKAANRLAHSILARRGRNPEPVALFTRDYVPLLIAHLAVLKAGKISFALDPAAPQTKTAHLLEDSQATLIIADADTSLLARPWAADHRHVIKVDELDSTLSEGNPDLEIRPDSHAYIRYTSGSTGQSKGGIKTHRHVLHAVRDATNAFHICAEDRLALLGSFGKHVFQVLLNGAALFPFDLKKEGLVHFAEWLIQQDITLYFSFPTAFRRFVGSLSGAEKFSQLRVIELEGEPVYKTDVELYRDRFSSQCLLVNSLSSAETGTICRYFVDQNAEISGSRIPVGYPVEDVDVLLLDETGRTVALNQIGEVAVRSHYLSAGYWRRPELTREKFVAAPESKENYLYLTGDLGSMGADGCLELLGRKDFQVKIRSFRVDVSEVESALAVHPELKEVTVIAKEDRSGNARLIAYVVPRNQVPLTNTSLRNFLKEKLPDYMVPSAFVTLDELPLMATGKVDRRALPEPAYERPDLDTAYIPPRSPIEQEVAKIWAEVLSLDRVGIHDNLFDLGGHSLAATQVVSRVTNSLGAGLSAQSLLRAATVADMAAAILQEKVKEIGSNDVGTILAEVEKLSDCDALSKLAAESTRHRMEGKHE